VNRVLQSDEEQNVRDWSDEICFHCFFVQYRVRMQTPQPVKTRHLCDESHSRFRIGNRRTYRPPTAILLPLPTDPTQRTDVLARYPTGLAAIVGRSMSGSDTSKGGAFRFVGWPIVGLASLFGFWGFSGLTWPYRRKDSRQYTHSMQDEEVE
jgi:hypothetical protein